jgi:hypothetical protein
MPHTYNKGSSKYISNTLLKKLVKRVKSRIISKDDGRGRCWRLSLKLNGRGYPQFTYHGTKYLAHRIMACIRRNGSLRRCPVYKKKSKIQASHRCGNKWCVNPRHLVFEPEPLNQTRDCCHKAGYFTTGRGYRCPHSPRCTYLKGLKKNK